MNEKNDSYSDECFYKGHLVKEMTGHTESYYFCRCMEDYKGDNC